MDDTPIPQLSLTDIVSSVCSLLEPSASSLSIRLTNTITGDIQVVYCKQAATKKALSLILASCIENSLPNETITIKSSATPTTIDLSFELTPNPMFILMAKRLFEPIEQQLNAETIRTSPQSYISLLLARKLAFEQRMKLWFHTENNSVCTIHCLFVATRIKTHADRAKPLVLIIEDNKHIRKLMELYLKQAGFETVGANDGDQGLEIAQQQLPDLITLDVMMPSKDGWQVLAALKKNPDTNMTPVVVVSVMKDTQIGYELGASDYLTKPVEHDDLIASAKRLTIAPIHHHDASGKGIRKIGVIDPSLEAVDLLMDRFSSYEFLMYEADLNSIFEALSNAVPDALCITPPEDVHAILPLLHRLRLHAKLWNVPFYIVTKEHVTDQMRDELEGLVSGFFTAETLTKESFATFV